MRTTTIPWGGRNLSQRLAAKIRVEAKTKQRRSNCATAWATWRTNRTISSPGCCGTVLVEWLARVEAALATIAAKSRPAPLYLFVWWGK